MPDRIYTEEEVAALLERAAALQAQAGHSDAHRPGLTLAELESAAAEAGLDPALLRQAAREMEAPGRASPAARANTSATHVFSERWVPGALTEEAWEDIVAELRHRFDSDLGGMMGMPGYGESRTEQIGRAREWKHTSLSGIETRVMLRPRAEGVRVQLSQRVGWGSPMVESIVYGAGTAFIATMITLGASSDFALTVAVLVLIITVPLIYAADRAWRRKKHRDLEALADRIASLAADHAPQREAEPQRAAPELDASLLDDAAPEESAAEGRSPERRRTSSM